MKRYCMTVILSVVSVAAAAADANLLASPRASQRPAETPRDIEIYGVVGVVPGYLGAQKQTGQASILIEGNLGNGVFFGQDGIGYRGSTHDGFSAAASLGPSLSRREQDGNADDHNRLKGMGDVSPRAQINVFGNYDAGPYHVSAWVQREMGNRSGGELQLIALYDLVSSDRDLVQAYVGVDYANKAKMQTFFGVTSEQATSSGNPAFAAKAGIGGTGLGVGWRHAFNKDWIGMLDVAAISLKGSAADSPLTARKTSGAVLAGLGYRF